MKLREALEVILQRVGDNDLIIAIFGNVEKELYSLRDRPGNFYMRGAMGLASSIGLGLALAVPDKQVIVLDGDGSILMNLGSFATMASESPPNLIHIVLDNESHATIGSYPTATAKKTDLAAVARGAGILRTEKATSLAGIKSAFRRALRTKGPHVIVAKLEREPLASQGVATRLVFVKERFMARVREDNPNLPAL